MAREWQDSEAVAQLFSKYQSVGTFVVYDVKQDKLIGYNQIRANSRYIPASTFKVVNSLIGLQTKAVKDIYEKLPYDSAKHQYTKPLTSWQHDMGLKEAIKISNVPIYQELARRIGLLRMQTYIKLLNYGNTDIGQTVDTFWLEGPLKISAVEQVMLLADLAREKLPTSVDAQQAVKEITLLERGENWQLHGKTGWADSYQPSVGWFVGWVETQGTIYAFALNVDMPNPQQDLPKRMLLTKQALAILGIL